MIKQVDQLDILTIIEQYDRISAKQIFKIAYPNIEIDNSSSIYKKMLAKIMALRRQRIVYVVEMIGTEQYFKLW